ncbi:unnamed protein product [Eruca vesicaria subsp. sativa]|uniref:Uncharacterized protein n=1 Tax=Eruca vesicaria subsp. sativa TaxID=29727 RepID=A0ABC8J8I7_ERUVS|nr:unnamed protein product [Eruca vesicaria subsp. sativa]
MVACVFGGVKQSTKNIKLWKKRCLLDTCLSRLDLSSASHQVVLLLAATNEITPTLASTWSSHLLILLLLPSVILLIQIDKSFQILIQLAIRYSFDWNNKRDGRVKLQPMGMPQSEFEHTEKGHPKIIYRDIKSANILLDDEYEVQATRKTSMHGSGKAFIVRVSSELRSKMGSAKKKRRRFERKARGVKICRANKATPATKNAKNIVLWDLENHRIPIRYSRTVGNQFKAFLKAHGYEGEVLIEAYSAMKGLPPKRVPEEVIAEFNKSDSGITHVRVDSDAEQAADEAIKARIDVLIDLLEDDTNEEDVTNEEDDSNKGKQGTNFFIVSSDGGFDTYFETLTLKGHHTFLIYDKNSTNEDYLQSVSASCKCTFKEFAALPKVKPIRNVK